MLYFRRPRCRSPFFVTERAESLARGTPPQFAARRCHGERHSAARRGQGPGAREEAGGEFLESVESNPQTFQLCMESFREMPSSSARRCQREALDHCTWRGLCM
ncbi:unnamed protein product [Effrenium voratum]|nr:unnamed protein product [Effrenium voratum]